MLYTESTVIADVVSAYPSGLRLSITAEELYLAFMSGVVVRRYTDDDGTHITHMSDASLKNGTYSFSFSNGDTFTCSSADAYPSATGNIRASDTKAPMFVTFKEEGGKYVPSANYTEINEAVWSGRNVWAYHPEEDLSLLLVSYLDGLLTFSATDSEGNTHYVTIDDTNEVILS